MRGPGRARWWVVRGAVVVLVLLSLVLLWRTAESRGTWPTLGIGPSPEDPIRISPPWVRAGKWNKMTIGFFNAEEDAVAPTVTPSLSCTDVDGIGVEAEGLSIPSSAVGNYSARVHVSPLTEPGYYPCVFTIRNAQKAFFLEVR